MMQAQRQYAGDKTLSRIWKQLGWVTLISLLPITAQAETMEIDKRFTGRVFFEKHIDLTFDGLHNVKAAIEKDDYPAARRALGEYYRNRQIRTR